jgi:hypothetical protein
LSGNDVVIGRLAGFDGAKRAKIPEFIALFK